MAEFRRGWTRHEGEDWWFPKPVQQKDFGVKFTEEGSEKLFGDSSDDSELHLPDALQFASHLVRGKDITPSGACAHFTSMLETDDDPVPSLEYLSWRTRNVAVTPVLDAINSKKLSKLSVLQIWQNELKVEVLARAIGSGCLPFLEDLELHGAEGHLALANVMAAGHLPLLQRLVLTESIKMSSIECQAYAMAFSLEKLPSLTCIDFSWNPDIGNQGVEALAHAIQSGGLKNLAELGLCRCGIQDDGLIAIADSFRAAPSSSSMLNLNFGCNPFTDVGLLSLADVLQTGHLDSLQILSLLGCSGFSRTGASALVSALSFNVHLNVELVFHWQEFPHLERRKDQFLQRNSRYRHIMAGLVGTPMVPATFGKVYLCGNPEVGKTTLRKSLQRGLTKSLLIWERRPHVENRTRGIDVSKFSTKCRKRRGESPITLLVWDMAGQRDYHLIHNAFFPDLGATEGKATTFVVVCSSTSPVAESEQQLDYWLRFVSSSCGKTTHNVRHVMVVLNRMNGDRNAKSLAARWKQALESLRGKFRDYLDIRTDPFIMDVRRRKRVDVLKKCLLEHSRKLLRDEEVPEICQFLVRKQVTAWSQEKSQFPVLDWTEFHEKVRETSSVPWREEDLLAATRYLSESGVLIYIDNAVFSARKLVVLDPNWFCGNIVGNMFLHADMVDPAQHLFRMEVDNSTGSISISKFKEFFKSFSKDWTDSNIDDLIAILLWLGLCYQGREENIFVPSLITKIATPWDDSGKSNSHDYTCEYEAADLWVMGFSVEHHKNELTLAPMTLWHRFQVELAQTKEFNGRLDNDFSCGRHFMRFSVHYMAVLIQVTTNQGSPTFDEISIFVKPLLVDNLDASLDAGNQRKQRQVDLANDLVERLLKLWNEVSPGVEYLRRVIWPWPASQSGLHIMRERNVDVEVVKKWVQEHNLGTKMQWMVGSGNTITEDQLLASKDKGGVRESVQRSLEIVSQVLKDAVELRIYPPDVLTEKVSLETLSIRSENMEEDTLPRSGTGNFKWVVNGVKRLDEKLNAMDKKLDNLQKLSRGIVENQKRLRQKLQDAGDIFLQDKDRICPRFIFLGEKNSGRWTTLKEALSPSVTVRLHFYCEANYDDYRQHEVEDQHGLDVSELKDWVQRIAPWLRVSLTCVFIATKIAANFLLPGVGSILPNVEQWQGASMLSEGIAMATGFSKNELDKQMMLGLGLDANKTEWDSRDLYGKSREAVSKMLGKMTPQAYEEKLGLRKVCLYYGDGSLHGVVWICNACLEKYRRSSISVSEL